MFYHINTLPSQASFHQCLSKPHQKNLVVRLFVDVVPLAAHKKKK